MRGESLLSHATSIRFTASAVRDWQQSKTQPVFSCEVLTTTTTINGSSPDMRNGDFVAGRGELGPDLPIAREAALALLYLELVDTVIDSLRAKHPGRYRKSTKLAIQPTMNRLYLPRTKPKTSIALS